MQQIKWKWIEIQFYMLIKNVYDVNHDIQDIFSFIEFIGSVFNINIEITKRIAYTMFFELRAIPKRKEIAVYAMHFNIPVAVIAKYTNYKRQYIYQLTKKLTINDLNVYINWAPEEYAVMDKFINTAKQIKEWLI